MNYRVYPGTLLIFTKISNLFLLLKGSPLQSLSQNLKVLHSFRGPHDSILTGKDKSGVKKTKLDTQLEKEYEEFVHDETDYYKPEQRNIDTGTVAKLRNGKEVPNREKAKPKPSVTESKLILWKKELIICDKHDAKNYKKYKMGGATCITSMQNGFYLNVP